MRLQLSTRHEEIHALIFSVMLQTLIFLPAADFDLPRPLWLLSWFP